MRRAALLLVCLLLLLQPGCMTLLSQYMYSDSLTSVEMDLDGNMIYSGTRINIDMFAPPWIPVHIPPIDLPLCLVLDTALLPLTITQTILFTPEKAKAERDAKTEQFLLQKKRKKANEEEAEPEVIEI